MKTNKDKQLKLSGILFAISTICYTIMIFQSIYYGSATTFNALRNLILTITGAVFIVLYCFSFHKKEKGKTIYFIGIGAYTLLNVFYFFSNLGYLSFYVLTDTLYLALIICMIIIKTNPNRTLTIVQLGLFACYTVMQIVSIFIDLIQGYTNILWILFVLMEAFAFLSLWWFENKHLLREKSTIQTPLEDNLISLKQLYDDGVITEEEYQKKKADILSRL